MNVGMSASLGPIVVPAATGQQARASIRALIQQGRTVRALVRDAGRSDALELARDGAEVVTADLDDERALARALDGASGLFLAQPGYISAAASPRLTPGDELRRGRAILALAAQVSGLHVVLGSSIGADRASDGSMLHPKKLLEEELWSLDIPATVLRPVGFMENHAGPRRGLLSNGILMTSAPPNVSEQLIAVSDIGRFVAEAFMHPDAWIGVTLDIAADELTAPQIAAAIGTATHTVVRYRELDTSSPATTNTRDAAIASLYAEDRPMADVRRCRAILPNLLTFTDWLRLPDADPLYRYVSGAHR